MISWLVTVKVDRDPHHDPHNKLPGQCPLGGYCSDTTGQHHTVRIEVPFGWTAEKVGERVVEVFGWPVTRVEADENAAISLQ